MVHLFTCARVANSYPNPTWAISLRLVGMDVPKATSIWKIVMNPHDVFMEDISNVFFDTTSKVTNMSYLKSQQFAFEHGDEKKAINKVFREECAIGLDGEVRDLQVHWTGGGHA